MAGEVLIVFWCLYIYTIYQIRKQSYDSNSITPTEKINLRYDLKEIYRLIEIVKKEMKEQREQSSLSINECGEVRDFCRSLLNSSNSGVYNNKDFTENRKKQCLTIYNYCCNCKCIDIKQK